MYVGLGAALRTRCPAREGLGGLPGVLRRHRLGHRSRSPAGPPLLHSALAVGQGALRPADHAPVSPRGPRGGPSPRGRGEYTIKWQICIH